MDTVSATHSHSAPLTSRPVQARPNSHLQYDEDEDWDLFYPSTDGKPMADNTEQLDWLMTIVQNLMVLLSDQEAFVAGNLMWYPIKNNNQIFLAPDVMVALTRPQRKRLSYIQSRENGVAPQIVFEILSPSNTKSEMEEKLRAYDLHGVQEYYVYDPDTPRNLEEMEREEQGKRKVKLVLKGYLRRNGRLAEIENMQEWASPSLGIRFRMDPVTGLEIYHPDGRPFEKFTHLARKLNQTAKERDDAAAERDHATAERDQIAKKLDAALAELETLRKQLLPSSGSTQSKDDVPASSE